MGGGAKSSFAVVLGGGWVAGEGDGLLVVWAASWAWASAAWRFRRASRRRRAREGGTLRGGGIVGVVEEDPVVERGLRVEVVAGGEKSWRGLLACWAGKRLTKGLLESGDY